MPTSSAFGKISDRRLTLINFVPPISLSVREIGGTTILADGVRTVKM